MLLFKGSLDAIFMCLVKYLTFHFREVVAIALNQLADMHDPCYIAQNILPANPLAICQFGAISPSVPAGSASTCVHFRQQYYNTVDELLCIFLPLFPLILYIAT